MSKEWFANWFDSEYYHILYKNRDHEEAEHFVSNLISRLNPDKSAHFLDLACGKGRHSIFINKLGYTISGVDLSENSIKEAKQHELENLKFDVHDMREIYKLETFDYVLNLFTSFGYFENKIDNLNVLISIKRALKDGGTVVIDFLNKTKVVENLVAQESKTIEGINFDIQKEIIDGKVKKHIRFEADNQKHHYTESVQLIDHNDFQLLFDQVGLQITDVCGNYDLDVYDEETSDRLIIFAKKL